MPEIEEEIELCLGDDSLPVFKALIAEVKQPSPNKGSINIQLKGECVSLKIKTSDISRLRAISNSFLNIIYAVYSTITLS